MLRTQEETDSVKLEKHSELRKQETEWIPGQLVKPIEQWDEPTRMAVARRKMDCPICRNETTYRVEERGTTTGVTRTVEQRCRCGTLQLVSYIGEACIPPHDRHIKLGTLEPSNKSQLSLEKQAAVIAELRANPDRSYAFFGSAGTSKTTFCAALCHRAIVRWANAYAPASLFDPSILGLAKRRCPIWRVSAKTLLEDFVRDSMHEEDERGARIHPAVDRAKIAAVRSAGQIPRLFIEEIDKVKYTEFKINALFELFDAIYEQEGQIVFNTNLPLEQFAGQFGSERRTCVRAPRRRSVQGVRLLRGRKV